MSQGVNYQGNLGEKTRLQSLKAAGVPAENLNKHVPNMPNLDLSTQKGFESVKIYTRLSKVVSHILDSQAADAWASSRMRSNRVVVTARLQAVAGKLAAANTLPKGFPVNGSAKQVQSFVKNNTSYVVADDQVTETREKVIAHVKENPAGVGLNPNDAKAIAAYCASLSNRIVGVGKNLAALVSATHAATQAKIAKQAWAAPPPPLGAKRGATGANASAAKQAGRWAASPAKMGATKQQAPPSAPSQASTQTGFQTAPQTAASTTGAASLPGSQKAR